MAINWIQKGRRPVYSQKDVVLSVNKQGKKQRANITFRNKCAEMIAPSGFIYIGIDGNRLYFRDGDENGYRVTETRNPELMRTGSTNDELVAFVREHGGEYNIGKELPSELYFIETV